jgi:transcriptional regulator with XRE-family HTH domain
MTPLTLLLSLSGLSQREAAEFLSVSASSVDKMSRGTRSTPPGIIDEMKLLIAAQDRAAAEALAEIKKIRRAKNPPDAIEIGYPADDHEARALGWPCVGAWCGMAARVVAGSSVQARLVPRGSTPATAAAADAHDAARYVKG